MKSNEKEGREWKRTSCKMENKKTVLHEIAKCRKWLSYFMIHFRFVSISVFAHPRRLCSGIYSLRWHTIEWNQPRIGRCFSWSRCKWQTTKVQRWGKPYWITSICYWVLLQKNRCYHKNHALKQLKKRKIDKWANKSYFSTLIIWTQLKRILLK